MCRTPVARVLRRVISVPHRIVGRWISDWYTRGESDGPHTGDSDKVFAQSLEAFGQHALELESPYTLPVQKVQR
jgi:hypothetical protein